MAEHDPTQHWAFDKRIPIGFLLGLIVQTFILGTLIGGLDSRVSTIEANRFTNAQGARMDERISNNAANLDRLENRTLRSLDEIKQSLREIEKAVSDHARDDKS